MVDALRDFRLGADAIGLVFWSGTPRVVTLEKARAIIFDMRGYPFGTAWPIAPRGPGLTT